MRALSIALWALTACGPSIEGLCEDLAQECSEERVDYVDQCIEDGEGLERQAESAGCEDAFADYLDCVDVRRCDWDTECTSLRAELDGCLTTD